ncbi:tryptophan-rich sensory protein [Candidatus Roizmanbacteria bacterium]|nr:tryptophan-rich sensory protein [Candidatus Roizmanbacteria bacterium]
MKSMKKPNPFVLALCIGISLFAGALGSLATFPSIPTWYATLHKPTYTPPNWVFGPVWTTLYILMGIALYLVFQKKTKKVERIRGIYLFFTQLALNVIWSVVFFGIHQIGGGCVVIVLLWLTIALTILNFYKISKPAAYCLVPYLVWTSYASFLNFSLLFLN